MSGTTINRRIAAERRGPRRRAIRLSALLLPTLIVFAFLAAAFSDSTAQRPNLSLNVAEISCINATTVADSFGSAVEQAKKTPPDYTGVEAFGFAPPANPKDFATLQQTLAARLDQVHAKARTAVQGTCTDAPKATVIDANGASKTLPIVDGTQPMTPVSGSDSNRDTRTLPVTVGTDGDNKRTDTWSSLDNLYGDADWYVHCANANLSMLWDHDVPKYVATEGEHDNRFILAVNVSTKLTDDQIRDKAAADGNPNVDNLQIVRTDSIINTRHLGQNRCDEFIDTRSMIRVSLGKVIFDENGAFKGIKTDEGIFVDCHNLWRLPKSKPVPTQPPTTPKPSPTPTTPSTTPGTTPPTTPPTTRPPTTTKPPTDKCIPPQVENNNGKCIVPKKKEDGPGNRGNVPDQVKGTNPPPSKNPEPRPKDPPATYKPPAPPKEDKPDPQPTRTRTTPPPVENAPPTNNPGTKAPCAPGIPEC